MSSRSELVIFLSSNDGTAEVAADIFNDCISITEIRLGINIETIFIFFINFGLGFLIRRADEGFAPLNTRND